MQSCGVVVGGRGRVNEPCAVPEANTPQILSDEIKVLLVIVLLLIELVCLVDNDKDFHAKICL